MKSTINWRIVRRSAQARWSPSVMSRYVAGPAVGGVESGDADLRRLLVLAVEQVANHRRRSV
jgi:hypothetical protein